MKGRVLRKYDSRAVFENLDTGNCLVITQVKEGWSKDIQVCDRSQLADLSGQCQVMGLEAIFGFYEFSHVYVALVVESEKFLSVAGIEIRKVSKTAIVPLFRHERVLSATRQKDEDMYLSLLHKSFAQHNFFYSLTYDVTHTQQRFAKLSPRVLGEPIWSRANNKYFWNREVVLDMIACQSDDWIVPFMSAYIEFRPGCEIENEKFSLLFISRRSRMRQGCRFTRRGINEQGFVANHVETEQILLFPDGTISSHVQLRGSIPVIWSSPVHMKYNPKVYIESDLARSATLCELHVSDMVTDTAPLSGGGSVTCINLIDGKKDQGKLAIAFKEVVDLVSKLGSVSVEYVWFDFHSECKQKGKWQNLSKLVTQLDDVFASHCYFKKQPNGTVSSWQTGVFRSNCMDNLDRTNVVQSIFARRAILRQLDKSDVLNSGNVLTTPFKRFEDIYKQIWVNNANAMSVLYAGTGALKTDFTKTGKRTFQGMFNDGVNSCMRYHINNFVDASKQDSIDLLLGNYRPDPVGASPFLSRDDQEYLYDSVNKAFILTVLIFTLLLLISPHVFQSGAVDDAEFSRVPRVVLTSHFSVALIVTCLVIVYIVYLVTVRGSKIGDRLVFHPQLIVDSTIRLSKK
mmetsp:Transcript_61/g.120  ORF Transcript_61/g.120 Transcript_61/m.120 type:complete len:628 (-) Transcript_61:36-1919(-)